MFYGKRLRKTWREYTALTGNRCFRLRGCLNRGPAVGVGRWMDGPTHDVIQEMEGVIRKFKILISHILACMQRVLVGNGKTITTKKKYIRLLRLQNNRRCGFFLAVFTSGHGAGKGTSAELCGRRSANYKNAGLSWRKSSSMCY